MVNYTTCFSVVLPVVCQGDKSFFLVDPVGKKLCLSSHEVSFQRMRGATRWVGVTATPKCKESVYWKKREEVRAWITNSFVTTVFRRPHCNQ